MKLKYKLPLTFIPLICLPLAVVAALSYFELKQSAQREAEQQLRILLSQYSHQIEEAVKSAETYTEYISQDPLLHHYLLTADAIARYSLIQRPLYDRLLRLQNISPEHYTINVLLPDNSIDLQVLSQQASIKPTGVQSGLPVAARTAGAEQPPAFYPDPASGEVNLYTQRNIYLRDPGEVKDVVTTDLTLRGAVVIGTDVFSQLAPLNDRFWSSSGALLITDAQGQLLRTITQSSENSRLELPPGTAETGPRNIRLESGNHLLFQQQIYPQVWLQALIPEASVDRSGQIVAMNVITVSLIASILAIPLLLYLLNSQILTPVRQLTSAFIRLGKQEEEIQVLVAQEDELGDLSRLFNRTSLELHRSHRQIRNLAFSDSLTGLPNRFMFMKNLKQAMERASEHNQKMALLFLDLDRFKQINDSMGHNTGDALLQQVAALLQRNLRNHDLVTRSGDELAALSRSNLARLGGDEFTILLQDISSPEEARIIAERIIAALSEPLEVNNQQLNTGASIGISLFPQHGSNSEELIRHADVAMYQAKRDTVTRYRFFSERSLDEEGQKQIEARLYRAIKSGQIEVCYQPILDQHSLRTVAVEALLRWEDSQLGPVEPALFIPIAERCGLISLLSEEAINTALAQLKRWHSDGLSELKLSLNLCSAQLQDSSFPDKLGELLRQYQLEPQSVWLEIKEAQLLSSNEQSQTTITALKQAGYSIALDDFGTGYSSVSALRDKPAAILKIDHTVLNDFEHNEKQQSLVAAILLMAKTLNLKVIVEGIENEEQLAIMCEFGCDMLQGYLFSPPLAADDLSRLLNSQLWLQQSGNRYTPQ
ncbi:putative bifunctional diguanylate cyclase/phosphodiesterase [Marinobacterium jannaschii]|uniref:putative bifunctional diguanylate cyclase/phosphodiesterase n=1 Tax=Marinobacterium jannaschii TaxID=64970 RepID=UPI000685527F|nr:EAL domain-containing protein [Marinobacterium jannaschii]